MLTSGTRLGPYEILAPLGAGGMGEVFKARDTRLDRFVAVKIVSELLGTDGAALARFEREAKAVAALSHPNIMAIHDFGREGGVTYAVMELLEGQTLREALSGGPLSPYRATELASQIAKGLAAAHEKGIVHQDLKPENVFLTRGGHVKILDFGLARTVDPAGRPRTADSESPTAEIPTRPGTVLGTVGYMSPEQVRGETVDPRSDIFSFGVVLYEILAGKRPFGGGSAVDTLAATLTKDPDPLHPVSPPGLDRIVRRCLEKSPEDRFSSARDLAFALEAVFGSAPVAAPPADGSAESASEAAGKPEPALQISKASRGDKDGRRALAPRAFTSALIAVSAMVTWWLAGSIGWFRALEDSLSDAKFRVAKASPPDPRILLVSVDEASVAANPAPLMERADEFGVSLQKALDQGAAGVAIDLLLPERWGESEAFTKLALSNPEKLALAAYSAPDGSVLGPECLKGIATISLGAERTGQMFGFSNTTPDPDGVVRRARRVFAGQDGEMRDTFPGKAAQLLQAGERGDSSPEKPFRIDFSVDPAKFSRLSWRDLPTALEKEDGLFRGKLLMLGAEYSASGDIFHRIPHPRGGKTEISGLELNALAVNALLSGTPPRDAPWPPVAAILALALALAGFWLLGRPSVVVAAATFAALWFTYLALSFLSAKWSRLFLPTAGPSLVLILVATVVLWLKTRIRAQRSSGEGEKCGEPS